MSVAADAGQSAQTASFPARRLLAPPGPAALAWLPAPGETRGPTYTVASAWFKGLEHLSATPLQLSPARECACVRGRWCVPGPGAHEGSSRAIGCVRSVLRRAWSPGLAPERPVSPAAPGSGASSRGRTPPRPASHTRSPSARVTWCRSGAPNHTSRGLPCCFSSRRACRPEP